jgi:uncharacterized protein YecT (DUF1311 family)
MRSLTALAALSLLCSSAHCATADTMITRCSTGNDHPRMSQCVADHARAARAKLARAEHQLRATIAASGEDKSYLDPIRQRFDASVHSYHKYRDEQCSLREAVANRGVYAVEIRRACEAELDSNRAQALESDIRQLE